MAGYISKHDRTIMIEDRQGVAEDDPRIMAMTSDSDLRVRYGLVRTAPLTRPALLVSVLLGLTTGSLLAAALPEAAVPTSYALEQVTVGDLELAGRSLVPTASPALVEEAKACRAPLAMVVLKSTGSAGGSVRIRSGSYASPNVRIGRGAQRVALPYPAPFATGHGQIAIENASDGVAVFLRPGNPLAAGVRSTLVDVHWDPSAPCRTAAP